MTQDLMLVIGLVISGFSIPPILGALSEGRPPRVSAIMVMIGGSLVVMALSQKPSGYTLRDVPEAFVRVVAYYIH